MKKLFSAQIIILAAGSAFAWKTIFEDFTRFFNAGGDFFTFSGCRYPNPLATGCFYGAIGFVLALVMATDIWLNREKQKQKRLSKLLFLGTLFAWTMTLYEFYKYFQPRTGQYLGCGGVAVPNPFYTPCFTGASLYLISFLVSLYLLKFFPRESVTHDK